MIWIDVLRCGLSFYLDEVDSHLFLSLAGSVRCDTAPTLVKHSCIWVYSDVSHELRSCLPPLVLLGNQREWSTNSRHEGRSFRVVAKIPHSSNKFESIESKSSGGSFSCFASGLHPCVERSRFSTYIWNNDCRRLGWWRVCSGSIWGRKYHKR